jgi:hypothetical protein
MNLSQTATRESHWDLNRSPLVDSKIDAGNRTEGRLRALDQSCHSGLFLMKAISSSTWAKHRLVTVSAQP